MKKKADTKKSDKSAKIQVSADITKMILDKLEDEDSSKSKTSKWDKIDTCYACQFNNPQPSDKILSFDLDDTIKALPVGGKLMFDKNVMMEKIKEYLGKGFSLCIFSNQKGISTGQAELEVVQNEIERIFTKELPVPITCLFSTETDYYRKPYIGLLELYEEKYNGNINLKIKRDESIFVGDAAGRKKGGGRTKNDFSNSDYAFALNAGMKFLTPEMFFLGKTEEIPKIQMDLHKYDNNKNDHINYPDEKEIILLVGSPGSGKSTFAENIVKNHKKYVRISRDDLKTEKKVLSTAEENLNKNNSVIIDCTNPAKDKRKVYLDLAKKLKVKIRAFVMDIDKEMAFHMNNFRKVNTERIPYSPAVEKIPIHSFYKYYQEPTKEEGFEDVVKVNFVPGPFINEKEKAIFYMHTFS